MQLFTIFGHEDDAVDSLMWLAHWLARSNLESTVLLVSGLLTTGVPMSGAQLAAVWVCGSPGGPSPSSAPNTAKPWRSQSCTVQRLSTTVAPSTPTPTPLPDEISQSCRVRRPVCKPQKSGTAAVIANHTTSTMPFHVNHTAWSTGGQALLAAWLTEDG